MPVSAREDTIFYLAGKLVRRNLLASAAFGLLAISIVAGWYATYREAKRTEARFMEVRKLANFVFPTFKRVFSICLAPRRRGNCWSGRLSNI